MKVALISFSEEGGGGIAARRLFDGLKDLPETEVSLVVREKKSWDPAVCSASRVPYNLREGLRMAAAAWLRTKRRKTTNFRVEPNLIDDGIASRVIERLKPDVINIHWLGKDFLSIHSLEKINMPVVVTLHDSWSLTGGCFVPGECKGYLQRCEECPLEFGNRIGQREIAKAFRAKSHFFEQRKPIIVSPSRWLAKAASAGAATKSLRVEVIPHGVDVDLFRPCDRRAARTLFSLPQDKFLLLFGSAGGTQDINKGFDLLCDALGKLGTQLPDNVHLVVFGSTRGQMTCPIPIHFVGSVTDERAMCALYNAADALVVPSRWESFSLVTLESMACGTPVVAFGNSGPAEIIEGNVGGWTSDQLNSDALAGSLLRCFREARQPGLRSRCRERVIDCYRIEHIARKYAALYQQAC